MQSQCYQCGSTVLVAYNHKNDSHFVYCTGCIVKSREFSSKEGAIEAWDNHWDDEWILGSKVIFKA